MIALLVLGGLALSIIWVGIDASERDFSRCENWYWRSAFGWVVACIILWIAYFPLYLRARSNVPLKRDAAQVHPEGLLGSAPMSERYSANDDDQLRTLARKLGLSSDDPAVLSDLRKVVQEAENDPNPLRPAD